MDNTIIKEDSDQKIQKKERSAAYPSISIEAALAFVSSIYKHFRNDLAKRDDILGLIEGSHPRHIAASAYYGFLSRDKDSYQVTNLYKSITNYVDKKERDKALLVAFESPKLNKQLIDKFDGDALPETLTAHLSRFYGITEEAAPLAADVFIANASFCGVLDNRNTLLFKRKIAIIDNQIEPFIVNHDKGEPEDKIDTPPGKEIEQKPLITNQEPPLLLAEMNDEEKTKVRLSGNKFAYIIYPRSIKKIDVEILRKQLDVIELLAE
jgi:hypothetical protein